MSDRLIDVARRVVRRALVRVETLERRECLSHMLLTIHQANPVVQQGSFAIHADGVLSGFAQQGKTPPGVAATAEIIKQPAVILRAVGGGVPFIPGGPIAPPIPVNPAPAPVNPVPAPAKPAPAK